MAVGSVRLLNEVQTVILRLTQIIVDTVGVGAVNGKCANYVAIYATISEHFVTFFGDSIVEC